MSIKFLPHEGLELDETPDLSDTYAYDISKRESPYIRGRTTDGRSAFTHVRYLNRRGEYTEPDYPLYLDRWLNIHPNQYVAGRKICHKLRNGIRQVILVAQMQSGKTGTAKYVVHNLCHCSPVQVSKGRCYVICGMNDNDLRDQAVHEFADLVSPENILFSKQLQRINRTGLPVSADLIIVDESHYGSLSGSQLDKFLSLVEGEPFILSVSATPMAEMANSAKVGKPYVYLEPGQGYYGMKDIFQRDLIRQSANIGRNETGFLEIVENEYENQRLDEWKYNIIRLPHQWYYQDMEDAINELEFDNPIKFINHHTDFSSVSDFNDHIRETPNTMTIIWIYNSLRAGKQLDTTHIGFVYDTSNTGPDTISQSLLGRIMGYRKAPHGVTCYTDVASARKMLCWIDKMYDTAFIPQSSRCILNGYNGNVYSWKLHPPILVELPKDLQEYYCRLKVKYGNRYPYKDEFFNDLVNICEDEQYDKLEEIFNDYKPGRCGGLMILTESNARRTYIERWIMHYIAWEQSQPVRGFDTDHKGRFYYVFCNLNALSPNYGKVLVTYKEYINSTRCADYVAVNSKSMYALKQIDNS